MEYMVLIPLKKGYDTDLTKELKNSISEAYGGQHLSDKTKNACKTFNGMRENVVGKALDTKQETSIEVLQKYHDQLVKLQAKVPFAKIWFKWRDAFEKSSLFNSGAVSAQNLGFEKLCVLFNIGSMMSHVGGYQAKEMAFNDNSLKKAIKNFQTAAGIFEALKHSSRTLAQTTDAMFDASPECLQLLEYIMLAQTQEAFFFKAIQDQKSDKIIARISAQCQQYYNEILTQLRALYLQNKHSIPEWEDIFIVKQLSYTASTEFYMASAADKEKNFGEALSRFTKCIELFKAAESKDLVVQIPEKFKGMSSQAATKLAALKYDNDHIYHERIPDHKTLATAAPAPMAKPVGLEDIFFKGEIDLFEHLLPSGLYQSIGKLDAERTSAIQREILQLREASTMLNAVLASLNLPAAIEDVKGVEVPQSLKDKAKTVQQMGGVEQLDRLINELPGALERNKEILNEIERNLKEESEQDEKLRAQFKEKWSRTASSKLNATWHEHIAKYRNIINNAVDADKNVKSKYSTNLDKMRLLSVNSEYALAQAIPTDGKSMADSGQGNAVRETLRELMSQVEQLKAERETLEKKCENDVALEVIQSKFVESLNLHKDVNEGALITETIGSAFSEIQREIRENLKKQENLIEMIQESNNEFVRVKGGDGGNKRDDFLKQLAAAYDAYRELNANLNEGTKFYNDLTQVLVNLQEKVTNFCFARKTELEELLKNLQNDISKSGNDPVPVAPSYHTQPPSAPPTSSAQPAQAPPQPGNPFAQPQPPYPTQYPMNTPSGYYYPPPMPQGYNPYAPAAPTYYPPQAYYPAPHGQPQHPPAPGYPGYNPYQQQPPRQ